VAFYIGCDRIDLRAGKVEEVLCVGHDVWCSDVVVWCFEMMMNLEASKVGLLLASQRGRRHAMVSCDPDWSLPLPLRTVK